MGFSIGWDLITGMMLGIEFTSDDEGATVLVVDLLILRLVFSFIRGEE